MPGSFLPGQPPAGDNPDKRSLGEKIRDTVNRALDDPRRNRTQLDILNQVFENCARELEKMPQELNQLFNIVAMTKPSERNLAVIESLTTLPDPQGGGYSPIKRFGLPYNNTFTDLSIDDIVELPGYIRLHEVARDFDIAIKVTGVFSHEIKGAGDFIPQPVLHVDGLKTYEEGAMENAAQYPTLPEKRTGLPPKPPANDGKGGRKLDF